MTLPTHFHELLFIVSNPEHFCNTEPNGAMITQHERKWQYVITLYKVAQI
jgi:hypothetical protein